MKILVAQLNPIIGDLKGNADKILASIEKGRQEGADLVLFSELVLTGYPPDDFLLLDHFLDEVEESLSRIVSGTKGINAVVGLPRRRKTYQEKTLANSAAIISDGKILGYQDKLLLPTYDVFDERRYFEPASEIQSWELSGRRVVITICEDVWQHAEMVKWSYYHEDPVEQLKKLKPDLMLNLSASPFSVNKPDQRKTVVAAAAETLGCPVVLCNQVGGNDSVIYDGMSLYAGGDGKLRAIAKGFDEDFLVVEMDEEYSPITFQLDPIEQLYHALVLGVRDYFRKLDFKKGCLGLSGGIDSAVVACIGAEALGKENLLALTMPSRYSSEASVADAMALVNRLGITCKEVPIEGPFKSYLELLGPYFEGLPSDTTEENLQARIRGMILMAFSNKLGYIVLSTGNKSEVAMGYATLYGDMCGGLSVISDVLKTQVYDLARWINRNEEIIPWNTIEKPPSAELRPDQKDTDALPPYDVVDAVLVEYVVKHESPEKIAEKHGYPMELVEDLVKKIHQNEYKRQQAPPGLRVTEKAFSIGRKFPIVQKWTK